LFAFLLVRFFGDLRNFRFVFVVVYADRNFGVAVASDCNCREFVSGNLSDDLADRTAAADFAAVSASLDYNRGSSCRFAFVYPADNAACALQTCAYVAVV